MRLEHKTAPAAPVNVLDLTHDAICIRSPSDVIEYWNRSAEELYGWTADEAVGRVRITFCSRRSSRPAQSHRGRVDAHR
jgi:PAS domain S-box-containing protein